MSSFFRLTNGQRDALVDLPVWTTKEDRRLALSAAHPPLKGVEAAISAVRNGRKAPPHLGEILAVARYEDAGWMPSGGFDRWRRWIFQGAEELGVGALIEWLDSVENSKRDKLNDIERVLTTYCQEQDARLAAAQAAAARAHQERHAHYQGRILAGLSSGDVAGAQEIARRLPPGTARDAIDNTIHDFSAL